MNANKDKEKKTNGHSGLPRTMVGRITDEIKKRKKFAIIAAVIVGIIFLIALAFKPKPPDLNILEAKKTDLIQEVSVTGKVKAAESVSLSFERVGRVSYVSKSAGDRVSRGSVIASLDNSDLEADLLKAEAAVRSAEADLGRIVSGTRPEEVAIQTAKVESARQAFDLAAKDLSSKLSDHYGKTDELIKNKIDRFFYNAKTDYPQLSFNINDYYLENKIELGKEKVEEGMSAWKSAADPVAEANAASEALDTLRILCDDLLIAFGGDISTVYSQSTVDGWETDTASVRTSVSAAASAIVTSKEKYISGRNALTVEERQLTLSVAGPTSYQVESYSAGVESAKAVVQGLNAEIRKGMLISPISGVIGKVEAEVGESISSGTVTATVISDKKFQIETFIPEVDISKVHIDAVARVTLDAYGSDVLFDARLISIDPGETIIEGVTTYKATIEFIGEDDRVRSGMTANIDIVGGDKVGVLAVPQRAVISDDGRKFLEILRDKDIVRVEVGVGFKGSDGYIEITEGLEEGDKVVVSR